MKKAAAIVLLVLLSQLLPAQGYFRTLAPATAIIAGEPFRVQYIVEDGEELTSFSVPDFHQFKVVRGPDIYNGQAGSRSRNYIYTIVAMEPGRYIVPGTRANIFGKWQRSNDVFIEVISADMAARQLNKDGLLSDYYLKPGENPQDKIKQNLFLKVSVNKRTCYTGEPVMATFKLYSRLQSKSDIVKNPGFYGFTMFDMVSLQDKITTTENIGGKIFDVHTIRQVQLYPLQAGTFTIDEMRVKNRVEFSRSAVNKKTEQQIAEGMLNGDDAGAPGENTEIVESEISTEPVTITVKPVAEKNKPANYNGAVGSFSISAALQKNQLLKNEEGVLELTISGKGNFIQLSAPDIQWPAGIEGFESTVKDTFDRSQSPLTGSRVFRYTFTSAQPGQYSLPAINLSYFNPDSGTFKTIATEAVEISVSNKEKTTNSTPASITKTNTPADNFWQWAIGAAIVITLGFFFWRIKTVKAPTNNDIEVKEEKPKQDVEALLLPVTVNLQVDDKSFYTALQEALWKFFARQYDLAGSDMNKERLEKVMTEQQVNPEYIASAFTLLSHCETSMYTNVATGEDKNLLLDAARNLLERLNG